LSRALLAALLVLAAAAAAGAAGPDPATQPLTDGCTRKTTDLFTLAAPTWVYVGDGQLAATAPPPAPQLARGVVRSGGLPSYFGAHPTPVDDPRTHDSYDVIVNLAADPASAHLLGGDPAAKTGNYEGDDEETGRLHMELEQKALPTYAWPEQGDRVEARGSWVWDCGHWLPGGERTEFHPIQALWVDRGRSPRSPYGDTEGDLFVTTDKTPAGKHSDCAHRTKGDSAAFRLCLAAEPDWRSANGTYRYVLRAPPRPSPRSKLRVRIVDAGSTKGGPQVRVAPTGTAVTVSFTLNAPARQRVVVAKQVYIGWTEVPAASLPDHLRLRYDQLLVRRAMDPGCPGSVPRCGSVETTQGEQITRSPGEWNFYADVAGIWSQWQPAVFRLRDGQTVKLGRKIDFYVPRGDPWRLFVFARECDFGSLSAGDVRRGPAPCPKSGEIGALPGDDRPGSIVDEYRSARASSGRHVSNSRLDASTCPRVNRSGCYRLTYRVELVADSAVRAARRR
jgi:hypothetical protein